MASGKERGPGGWWPGDQVARALPAASVFLCGLAYGLGLARYLFEQLPTRCGLFGHTPAALALSLLVAVLTTGAWMAAARASSIAAPDLAPAALPLLFPLIALFDPSVNLLRAAALLIGGVGGCVALGARSIALRSSSASGRLLLPASVAIALIALYLRTLAPTVGEADTFEFQVDVIRLAIAHPSGYPLYILIGKLFSYLPLPGSLAFRINLSSAFFGVVAALGVYLLARLLEAPRLTAALAALVFGLSLSLWSRAVEAEVYTLNAAFVAAILLLLLNPLARLTPDPVPPPRASSRLYLFGLIFGLSLTNHLTTVLLAPAALAAFLFARPRAPWKGWLLAAGLFGLGLAVYLYIPIRWPAVNHGEVMTLGQFAGWITGRQAQGALRLDAWYSVPGRYAIVGRKAVTEFGWAGAALALLGLGWLARDAGGRRAAIVLSLAYAGYAFFALIFYVPDPDFSAFLIPAHLIQSALIGLGVTAVWRATLRVSRLAARVMSQNDSTPAIGHWSFVVVHSAFAILPLSFVWRNLPRVDQSRNWARYELGRYTLSQPLAPGALVLADSEKIAPLYYLQVAEDVRPDLTIAVLPDEAAYRAALDEGLAAGRTVYLGRYLPGLQSFYHLRSAGPLTEVGQAPLPDPPVMARPLAVTFVNSVRLLGANVDSAPLRAGDPLRFTLFWTAGKAIEANYLVRLRVTDRQGRAVYADLGRVPANGFFPTNAWQPGEVVPDFHEIKFEASNPPGEYTLSAGLFPPFSQDGMEIEGGGQWADVDTIRLQASPALPEIPRPARFRYLPASRAGGRGVWLVGYSVPEFVAPLSRVGVSLFWLADPDQGANSGNRVDDAASEIKYSLTASDGRPLVESSFDPAAWPSGAVIETTAVFEAPVEAQTVEPLLSVEGRSARCGWLGLASQRRVGEQASSCPLAPLRVEGEAIANGAVNFAGKVLLRSLTIETPTSGPGAVIRVSADWQALTSMDGDYTVFVHLLGPDGLVHGQIDTWPVQGTRPTSGWKPGERIHDTYEVRVPDDAPAGHYQVEVGWYLLATLERLPVLGEGGAPVDDKVLRGGLTIR